MQTYAELEAEIREEFPKFKMVHKRDSWLMQVADILLKLVTFWRMKTFMTEYATTLGYTLYVSDYWELRSTTARMIILRHERIHMRQRRRYGVLVFSLLYALVFFPVVFAYYRAKFEKEAYEETMRAVLEYIPGTGGVTLMSERYRRRVVRHFTSAEYLWMWPWRRSIERWYDSTVKTLLNL